MMKLYHVCKLSAREFALNKTFRFHFVFLSFLRKGGKGVYNRKKKIFTLKTYFVIRQPI